MPACVKAERQLDVLLKRKAVYDETSNDQLLNAPDCCAKLAAAEKPNMTNSHK